MAARVALAAERLPWWAKMTAKVVLARLPVPYARWRALGAFRHGAMTDPEYAMAVFRRHYERVATSLPPAFNVLELGPGDSLATALMASAYGAGRVYLVDAGAFAERDVTSYNELAQALAVSGRPVAGAPFASVARLLDATNAEYLTEGLRSLRSLPEHSIDLVFSQAVLEHVPLAEFDDTARALFALQRPGGVTSHRVDLQDHLAHSLNSLRFSRRRWESRLLSASGFYTNRLRARHVLQAYRAAGYVITWSATENFPELPVPATRLDPEFAAMAPEDLLPRSLDFTGVRPRS